MNTDAAPQASQGAIAAKVEIDQKIKLLDLPLEILQTVVDNFQIPRYILERFDQIAFFRWEEQHKLADSRKVLYALSRTCRILHSLAQPVLYTCLLDTAYDVEPALRPRILNTIQSMASSRPTLLSHARAIQIPAINLDILRHTSDLVALFIEHTHRRDVSVRMTGHLPEVTFQHLSQLQSLHIVRGGCAEEDIALLLQNLHHLRDLHSMRLSYLESRGPLKITVAPSSLRQLELAGCCPWVTEELLQALVGSPLHDLEISEYEFIEEGENAPTQGMVDFPLEIFASSVPTGPKHFPVLQILRVANAVISEGAITNLLRWLPTTMSRLEIRTIGSIQIFKPIDLWLKQFGDALSGMTILIMFNQHSIGNSQNWEDSWSDALEHVHKLVQTADLHQIRLIPRHLQSSVLHLIDDAEDSFSEEGETMSEDSSVGSGQMSGDDLSEAEELSDTAMIKGHGDGGGQSQGQEEVD